MSLLKTMQMSLVRAPAWNQVDVQGLCRGGPAPHWVWRPGELTLPLTGYSTQKRGPCTSPGQQRRAGPEDMRAVELALPFPPEALGALARVVLESLP